MDILLSSTCSKPKLLQYARGDWRRNFFLSVWTYLKHSRLLRSSQMCWSRELGRTIRNQLRNCLLLPLHQGWNRWDNCWENHIKHEIKRAFGTYLWNWRSSECRLSSWLISHIWANFNNYPWNSYQQGTCPSSHSSEPHSYFFINSSLNQEHPSNLFSCLPSPRWHYINFQLP